jgi:RecB family exonuclease
VANVAVTEPVEGPPRTEVDGVEVLGALSPSRAADFMTCPLLYRFRTVDRLPEPFSPDAVRGTLVHKVLEDLFDLPAGDRTPERARDLLGPAWDGLLESEPAIAEMLAGGEPEQMDFQTWFDSCGEVLDRYFTLEDPRRLEPAERELYVEALLDSRLLLRGFVDRLDVAPSGLIRVVDYKGLAADTPLPTPTGWTTMADVAVGDLLLGSDGRPTRVTKKSRVHHRPCYRVTFVDGSSVVCDNVHLWTVVTTRRQVRTTRTLDTDALRDLHRHLTAAGAGQSLWVEAAAPLDLPDVEGLPIAPWLLGAWLGDGDTGGDRLTVGRDDADDMLALVKEHWPRKVSVRQEAGALSVSLSKLDDRDDAWNVSFSTELQRAGLRGMKHIPTAYLRAGTSQRLELLRGLMDTDGWWSMARRRAGFTTTDDRLADDVVHLLRTLGIHPQHVRKPYTNAVRAPCTRHVIEFTPVVFNPFSLPRKAMACAGPVSDLRAGLVRRRVIRSVLPVDTVPTQCIAVDATDSLYLCGDGFVPTHNTGRSPDEGFEAKAMFQMKFYALVIWRTRGVVPAMLQLVYLGNGEVLRYVPDEGDLLATERKVVAVWEAIRRAEESGDWRPSPSRMCEWCAHQALCPAYGGIPPPLPTLEVPPPAADPAGDLGTDEGLAGRR